MRWSRLIVLAGVCAAMTGCKDSVFGVDLSGLWIAQLYQYESTTGATVDLIQRDGASMSLTVDIRADGTRRASVLFNDGMGGSETLSGDVDQEARTFTFPGGLVYTFTRTDAALILVNQSATFDFGSGPEAATLTIRLTQL